MALFDWRVVNFGENRQLGICFDYHLLWHSSFFRTLWLTGWNVEKTRRVLPDRPLYLLVDFPRFLVVQYLSAGPFLWSHRDHVVTFVPNWRLVIYLKLLGTL